MKHVRYLLALVLLAFAAQARAADWTGDDISTVVDEITGDVTTVAADLVAQLHKRTAMVTETVDDILTWLQYRRAPFLDFVNSPSGRCGAGSPCAQFRADLKEFALEIADLKDRFPVLAQQGLGDTYFADATDILPPFVLFGLYEILQRIPDWQSLPDDLADLSDELGDAQIFAVSLKASPRAAPAHLVRRLTLCVGQGCFGPAETPAKEFCSNGYQPLVDPVRLNELKARIYAWKDLFDALNAGAPPGLVVDVAGEGGGDFPDPAKALFKDISDALDVILNAVATHQSNLAVCRAVETDVSQRAPLIDYRTDAGVTMAYWVVKGIWTRRANDPVIVVTQGDQLAQANKLLDQAGTLYGNSQDQSAFGKICDAYAAIP
jgi:hypothetical protein